MEGILQALDLLPVAYWEVDSELCFTVTRGGGLRALGINPDQTRGLRMRDYFGGEDDASAAVEAHERALKGDASTYELAWAGKHYAVGISPMRNRARTIVGVAGIALDVTEPRRQAAALIASETHHRETKRRFLQQVLRAQEEERRRLARELHDETNQSISAAMLTLHALHSASPQRVGELVDQVRGVLQHAIRELNRVEGGLHPRAVEDFGLGAAIERHIHSHAELWGLAVDLDTVGVDTPGTIDVHVATQLYRIAQEALSNAARHSGGTRISVRVVKDQSGVELAVQDNGSGFDPDAISRGSSPGLGLVGIQERTALLEGRLSVDAAPGRGTRVCVRVPLAVHH